MTTPWSPEGSYTHKVKNKSELYKALAIVADNQTIEFTGKKPFQLPVNDYESFGVRVKFVNVDFIQEGLEGVPTSADDEDVEIDITK